MVQLVNANGTVKKTYDYEAYGNELKRDVGDSNPFRYCGEYYDTETGFIYLRARYYSPEVGRFISADPAKDGLNWYAYCNNNPLAYIDPSGMKAEKDGGGFSWRDVLILLSDLLNLGVRKLNDLTMSNTALYKNSKIPTRSKRPEPSHATLFTFFNDQFNRHLDKDNDPTYNQYVHGQGRTPYKNYMNGLIPTGINGCEAIAIHNARVALGYESSLKQVIWDIDEADANILGGAFGASPYLLGRVLDRYGMDYDYVNNVTGMDRNGVYIISYWNTSSIRDGLHTVMVTNTNGKYAEYNSHNGAMAPNLLFSLSSYADRFIFGYYLGY